MSETMRFAIFIYDGVEPIDLGATFGTLSMARRVAPQIEMVLVAERAGMVTLANGMVVAADRGFDDCPAADILLISGGPGWPAQCKRPAVARFIAERAPGAIVASVCTGGMILAETGLLDGLTATTKSKVSPGETAPTDLLARDHPAVNVVEALVVDAGPIVTGGGVTLAIDTTLHLIQRCLGETVAEETARIMEYDRAWRTNRDARPSYLMDNAVA